MGNALSAMIKRERITLKQAHACIKAYQQIPIKFVDVELTQSLSAVDQFIMYAYDAYLLGCAVNTRRPLLTLDAALAKIATQFGIQVLPV